MNLDFQLWEAVFSISQKLVLYVLLIYCRYLLIYYLDISFQADVHYIGVLRHLKVQNNRDSVQHRLNQWCEFRGGTICFLTNERWFLLKNFFLFVDITNIEMLNIKEQVTYSFIKISAAIVW